MKLLLALCVAALGCGSKGDGDKTARSSPTDPLSSSLSKDAAVSKAPERTVVTSVEIKVVDPSRGPAREVYPRELAAKFGATLSDSPWYVSDEADAAGFTPRRAVVEVLVGYSIVEQGSDGSPAVIAVIEAKVSFEDGVASLKPQMNILAERGFTNKERSNLDGIVAEHVERAAADAAAALIVKEKIRVGPPDGAIAGLSSQELDIRTWSLAVIGERKLSAAFDQVVERLHSERDEERDAAIGALLSLRDPRAVGPLTRLAEFGDHALMRRMIDAVATLGGDEALDYLEFVSSGHPDDEIKQQAVEALRRLRRRVARQKK